MKTENIPADIKSKSLKEARNEINQILIKLESKNLDLSNAENTYKRLIQLNKHIENLFKMKSKEISKS
jgi:exonuclease VII small subunit|tara:strand:+ start:5965 stop:6168 length:204 start_codon:yes stop_codon:yes gene_type:complete